MTPQLAAVQDTMGFNLAGLEFVQPEPQLSPDRNCPPKTLCVCFLAAPHRSRPAVSLPATCVSAYFPDNQPTNGLTDLLRPRPCNKDL